MDRIYLDHAATTATRPDALAALRAWLDDSGPDGPGGNPSSTHAAGRRMRVAVEEAREQVAGALGAHPQDIVFTSGGTEADNLAVKGIGWAMAERGRRHLVTTAVEHPAVLDPARWMAEHQGFTLTVVEVGGDGRVDPERVLDAVRDDTAVVSVMTANNEIGAVNDIAAIGAALRERGVAFHTDAVQAAVTQPIDLRSDLGAWPVDALSLSGHKFGAPAGVGIAFLRRGVPVVPVNHGGGQDRGVRSGTFAAALDRSLAAALSVTVAEREAFVTTARELTDRLAAGLLALDGVTRNGPSRPEDRLPTHVHVSLDGVDGEALMFTLDRAGVAVSGGAACGSGAGKPSHVLAALDIQGDAAVRASVGWSTTTAEIDHAIAVFADVVRDLRAVGGGAVTAPTVG